MLLVLLAMLSGSGLLASPATAQPWDCREDIVGYFFRDREILRVDRSTGATSVEAVLPETVDGVGFNPVDGYFYGVRLADRTLVRIHRNGFLEPVGGAVPFESPDGTYSGDFDDQGHLWIAGSDGSWVEVDLSHQWSGGQIIGEGHIEPPEGLHMPGDWSYSWNGRLGVGFYGLSRETSILPDRPHLVFFDPVSRTLQDAGVVDGFPLDLTGEDIRHRATFTDLQGDLYVTDPDEDAFWRVDLNSVSATRLPDSLAEADQVLDGAQCRWGAVKEAVVRVVKRLPQGRNAPSDQFVVEWPGGMLHTSGDGTEFFGPEQTVRVGEDFWINDRLADDWLPPDGRYETHVECRDSVGNHVHVDGGGGWWNFVVPYPDDFTCFVDNNAIGQIDALLSKYPEPQVVSEAGQEVTYRFKLTNLGQTALTALDARDQTLDRPIDCPIPPGGLLPGESVECAELTRTVTQEDIDHGDSLDNYVHGNALDARGQSAPVVASAVVMIERPAPGISLEKTASRPTVDEAGQRIDYTYRVTNTGASTLHDIVVKDAYANGTGATPNVSCPGTTLAPQATMECTASYTVTQEDIDTLPSLDDEATAAGTDARGQTAGPATSAATVTVERRPGLALEKTAAPERVTEVGEKVAYSFTVRNTGNTTLDQLRIQDTALTGRGRVGLLDCPTSVLAPGGEMTCTAFYTVAQADIDRGGIDNTAVAVGTGPEGQEVTSPEAKAHVDADRRPGLSLVKTADLDGRFAAGEKVSYTYEVANTGNTTITELAVSDREFNGNGTRPAISCPERTVLPGLSVVCTATYTLVQADIDQGYVTNTATATAAGGITSDESTATVTGPAKGDLTLTKSATPATFSAPGQVVKYTFTATNSGDTTLTGVRVLEDGFTGTGPLEVACPRATLAPGASMVCTAAYEVTQQDVDNGSIGNSATALATGPQGVELSASAEATVESRAAAALKLEKTATPDTVTAAGETVEYGYLVTNTGRVTVDQIGIADDRFRPPGPLCPTGPLPPGRSVLCTGVYTVTAQDVRAGTITNTATAYASRADTGATVASREATAKVTVPPSSLALRKSVSPTRVTEAGERLTYTFEVTNNGSTVLSDLAVQENQFTGTGGPLGIDCPDGQLAPGAKATCTAFYTVTAADIKAGGIDNTAVATAVGPGGTPVTSPAAKARVTTGKPSFSSLHLAKKAVVKDVNRNGKTDPGDTVVWQITATNTGRSRLTGLVVHDPTAGRVSCPTTTLEPGGRTTCTTLPYTITQQDAKRGRITDTATASAKDPEGRTITSPPAYAEVLVHCHHHKPPRPPHRPGK